MQLKTDDSKNFYFDRTSVVAYRRFSETREREAGVDLSGTTLLKNDVCNGWGGKYPKSISIERGCVI